MPTSLAGARGNGSGLPTRPGQKVVVVVACERQPFSTNGTETPVLYPLDIGPIARLGPALEKLRVHYRCQGADSTKFVAKVIGFWSVDGETWSPSPSGFEAMSPQAGDLQTIAEYTTTSSFGLRLRLFLAIYDNTSITGVQSAQLTVVVEATLKS